ncbi:hypothetical protein D3C80_1814780 [compost metagenome]
MHVAPVVLASTWRGALELDQHAGVADLAVEFVIVGDVHAQACSMDRVTDRKEQV